MNLQTITAGMLLMAAFTTGCGKKDEKPDPQPPAAAKSVFEVTGVRDLSYDSAVTSGTIMLSIAQASGTAEPVNITVDNLPAGFNAETGPGAVTPPAEVKLTIRQTGPVTAGSYPVSIIAKSESMSKTLNAVLKVSVAPNTYTVSFPSPEFEFSNYAYWSVDVKRISGTAVEDISVDVSDAPAGLTPAIQAIRKYGDTLTNVQLIFTESSILPKGDYPMKIHVSTPTFSITTDFTMAVGAWSGFVNNGHWQRGTMHTIDRNTLGIHTITDQTPYYALKIRLTGADLPTSNGQYSYLISGSAAAPRAEISFVGDYYGPKYNYVSVETGAYITLSVSNGKIAARTGNIILQDPATGDNRVFAIDAVLF